MIPITGSFSVIQKSIGLLNFILRDNKVHEWSIASHKKIIKKGDLFIVLHYRPGSGSCYALGKVESEVKMANRTSEEVIDDYSKDLGLRERVEITQ